MNSRKPAVEQLLRENIRTITPYSSARSEFSGSAEVFLDANENYRDFFGGAGRNRYPDPLQRQLKQHLAELYGRPAEQIFLGNGSDEAIDLLYRAFARPGTDRAVIQPPTYGVYGVFAALNDVGLERCMLTEDFQMDIAALERVCAKDDPRLKLLFICSPNNPTGNDIRNEDIRRVLDIFPGIVVVDEAYQEFSSQQSALSLLDDHEHLVVLRTLSKAWGLANVRMGMAFASEMITSVLTNIKYPYNLSGPAQETALAALGRRDEVAAVVSEIADSRDRLAQQLAGLPYVLTVYPSSANFLLVKTTDADRLCGLLREQGIIIRNRTHEPGCSGCVRITVGSPAENQRLIEAMYQLENII